MAGVFPALMPPVVGAVGLKQFTIPLVNWWLNSVALRTEEIRFVHEITIPCCGPGPSVFPPDSPPCLQSIKHAVNLKTYVLQVSN